MKKLLLLLCFTISAGVVADDYWVSQYRAAPGNLKTLIETLKSADWDGMDLKKPVIMRHSQGDQWDLMLVGYWTGGSCTTDACTKAHDAYSKSVNALVDFEVSMVATSTMPWSEFTEKAKDAGLFHIEMFHAAAGKHDALYKEREMENAYLVATKRKANAIFRVIYGSDVDNFTIGFHKDMAAFAWSPDLPEEAFEKAAVDAGFKNRDDISFLLRELIVGHHDTLATQVK